MIELFKFGALGKLSDPSPFCVKVEAYLRMADLPYSCQSGVDFLRKAPKGKLPYIKDGEKIIPDSTFIVRHLQQAYQPDLDDHLNPEQKAIAHGMTKMIDENLYWTVVHARWTLDHNWAVLKKMFFGSMPFPLKMLVPNIARKRVASSLKGHGIGRHSAEEITELGSWDLQALSDLLGDKPYFLGDKPSTLDAAAYGVLAQMILSDTFSAPIFEVARSHENLVRYTNALHGKYFSDYTEA